MNWVSWLLSFIGVIGLIFLLFYALKKLGKKVSVTSGSKLRVLDRVSLGRDGMLLVVCVAGKLMLIGATPQRVEKLCDLEQTEEEYFSGKEQEQDFKSVLASVLWKKPLNGSAGSETSVEGSERVGDQDAQAGETKH